MAFNYRQMRRFGAAPAVTSWAIALWALLSAAALAVIGLGEHRYSGHR